MTERSDLFGREEPEEADDSPRKTMCLQCRSVNVPVIPVGLGGVGYCGDCIMDPSAGWAIPSCPFCTDPATGGLICGFCRDEGTWRMIEYRLAAGRGETMDRCGYIGAERRKHFRRERGR